jgi:uncharacterized protein (UPF0261 family)
LKKIVAIIGTLDTKGAEHLYLKEQIESWGVDTLVIDAGPLGKPAFNPDISAEQVARAGGEELVDLQRNNERARSIEVMSRGAAAIIKDLYAQHRVHGVISLGGGQGTLIGATAMQALPIGVPKVMVSTIAAVNPQPFVDIKDVTMMNPVVDIAGLNSLLKSILRNAAAAIAGMVKVEKEAESGKIRIGATMYGITTPCVTRVKELLEAAGFEVPVFAATGVGDRAMEDLIQNGYLQGVVDITTTNVGQELVGGINHAGPKRLEAAGERGIPQVISLGALDVVNFFHPESVPPQFKGRRFHLHNPAVTLMRTSIEENIRVGQVMASKLNRAKGPITVAVPLRGLSAYDAIEAPLYDPEANAALFKSLRDNLKAPVKLVEVDCHINDLPFADKLAALMLESWKKYSGGNC